MSTVPHNHKPTDSEHGTTGAYIVGFILSLAFTIIPYYLVVNKVVTGNMLVALIIGIAGWQMAIQLLFFLHLGRGPKPLYNVVFFFATAGVIVLTVGASLFIMNNLYHNMLPREATLKLAQDENISQVGGKDTGACKELGDNHIVTIASGVATPDRTKAQRCDTLTFINKDKSKYTLSFGSHPNDVTYGGEHEAVLDDGRPETLTLNELGYFVFHDHDNPNLQGSFSVAP